MYFLRTLFNILGETCGWVPKSRISVEPVEYPEKLFFMGQVLKCKVLEVNALTRKMILTLILSEEKLRPLGSKEKKASENVKKGQIYNNVKIVDVNADGLGVEIDGVKALLPKNHLTDHCSIADLILDTYKVNDVIDNVLCFEKDVLPIMTLKPSILAFESCNMTFDEIHEGQVIPTVVSNVKEYGVFVKLPLWKVQKDYFFLLRLEF